MHVHMWWVDLTMLKATSTSNGSIFDWEYETMCFWVSSISRFSYHTKMIKFVIRAHYFLCLTSKKYYNASLHAMVHHVLCVSFPMYICFSLSLRWQAAGGSVCCLQCETVCWRSRTSFTVSVPVYRYVSLMPKCHLILTMSYCILLLTVCRYCDAVDLNCGCPQRYMCTLCGLLW